jgi:hypothetical protein
MILTPSRKFAHAHIVLSRDRHRRFFKGLPMRVPSDREPRISMIWVHCHAAHPRVRKLTLLQREKHGGTRLHQIFYRRPHYKKGGVTSIFWISSILLEPV